MIINIKSENNITLFSFGYWGWGHTTGQMIAAVDAVEHDRGFDRPSFVDIRISRSVRAEGFAGGAFETTVGPGRYRWMRQLGNPGILTHSSPEIQIADPRAAHRLLELSRMAAGRRSRVLVSVVPKLDSTPKG